MQDNVGEATVLQGGEQGRLLEDVAVDNVGGQEEQRWTVVLRVGNDVLERRGQM